MKAFLIAMVLLAAGFVGYGCSDNPAENPLPKQDQSKDGSLK